MIPVIQTRFGDHTAPTHKRGDCFGACVASILEVGAAQVCRAPYDQDGWGAWRTWLLDRGMYEVHIGADSEYAPPPGYSIGWIESRLSPGWGHFVVCHEGVVVHDPDPESVHYQRPETSPDPVAYVILCMTHERQSEPRED